MSATYRIGNFSFHTREEYQASLRDAMRFRELKRIGESEEEIAYNYIRQLNQQGIHFESQLGADFYLRNEALCNAWEKKALLGPYQKKKKKLPLPGREAVLQYLAGFFSGMLVLSAIFFLVFFRQEQGSARAMKELQSVNAYDDARDVDTPALNAPAPTEEKGEVVNPVPEKAVYTERVLANRKLKEENADLTAWLSIPDTVIDYPVMQRPGDDSWYLSRDFYGNEDVNGLLVLDDDCGINDMGLLIHGHHMRSGAMFAALEQYRDPLFCATHPHICLSDMEEEREYSVFAVFEDHVNPDDEDAFHFYKYINVNDIEEYELCLEGIREKALYPIVCDISYGQRILMLSTCDYTQENGRLIVAAVESAH
ncbi:MAG: class B sortase [Lachnospiraceae bacterium]|nr:class B sortase [Lachnospiraceae bacterium]